MISKELAMMDIEEVVNKTKCSVPCKYTKYSAPPVDIFPK